MRGHVSAKGMRASGSVPTTSTETRDLTVGNTALKRNTFPVSEIRLTDCLGQISGFHAKSLMTMPLPKEDGCVGIASVRTVTDLVCQAGPLEPPNHLPVGRL